MTHQPSHNARIVEQFTRWASPFGAHPAHADKDGMDRLLHAALIAPSSRALDVACGPGIVACALAASAYHVVGIDLTPAMIRQARERQARLGLVNLDWQIGNAEALSFADGTFDSVITRYSFHHMTKPGTVLAEMRRVCKVGGRIVVIDATPAPVNQAAYDEMETLRDPSHATALTVVQFEALGVQAGLGKPQIDSYRLPALVDSLADATVMPALAAMLDKDIARGEDRIGVAARRKPDGIWIDFPISIFAWSR